jgi:hypothetical protein
MLVPSLPRAAIRIAALLGVVAFAGTGMLDLVAALAAAAVIAAFDLQNVLSTRNYFLAYVVILFGIGGRRFASGDVTMSIDLLVYVALFLAAYWGSKRLPATWRLRGGFPRPSSISLRFPTVLLMVLVAGWAALLAGQLGAYGLVGFYGGASLADRISSYGHADFIRGLITAAEQGLSILTVAGAAAYFEARVSTGARPNYLLLGAPLVAAPVLLLRRYDFAVGVLFLLIVQPVAARLTGTRYSVLASIPVIGASLALAFAVSIFVGSIRESALAAPPAPIPVASPGETETSSTPASDPGAMPLITEERTTMLVSSELSPITAYRDIREHPNDFPYQFGKTILPPIVAKVVPRSWLPDKPAGSNAYYNVERTPQAFAAGYALPITVFGDLLLNFGYVGALLGALALGVLARKLDDTLAAGAVESTPLFLIVYYNFYSLLRNDLANSLPVILLTTAAFLVLRMIPARFKLLR